MKSNPLYALSPDGALLLPVHAGPRRAVVGGGELGRVRERAQHAIGPGRVNRRLQLAAEGLRTSVAAPNLKRKSRCSKTLARLTNLREIEEEEFLSIQVFQLGEGIFFHHVGLLKPVSIGLNKVARDDDLSLNDFIT